MTAILGVLAVMWGVPIAAAAVVAAPCLISGGYRGFIRRQLVGNRRT